MKIQSIKISFLNGDKVEVINGAFYQDGIKIVDESLIYQLEQILNEVTK